MRVRMRVKGQAVSVRGSIKNYAPVNGTFEVGFDVPLADVDKNGVLQQIRAGSPVCFDRQTATTAIDSVWGLTWEFIG